MKTGLYLIAASLVLAGAVHAANPAMPVIPSAVFNITSYGAVGDGMTDNTIYIQNAISAANAAGGGIVEVPAGTFLSGPITLTNNLDLHVDTNGLLQMLPLYTYPGGTTNAQTFIYCSNVHDLAISGQGVIDGQGAPWWVYNATNNTIVRPMMVDLHDVNRLFIHDVTVQNSPNHHCGVRDFSGNVTISNFTINTVSPSPNTDGVDFTATNSIIENSRISDGDDNLAIGSTGPVIDLLITNCFFGTGHGVSILGPTAPMTNLMLINCTFNGTENGFRWKCNIGSSAPVQDINYYNVTMTNVNLPIDIYSYYNDTGTPDNISPSTVLAASNTVPVTATTPAWSNITISNLTIASSGDIGGVVWGPTEWPISNLTLICVTNTAPKTFDLYNVHGVKIINSRFNFMTGNTFTLCNAGLIVSNSAPGSPPITIGGAASTNSLALYNINATMASTNAFACNPITLNNSVLTNTGSLTFSNKQVLQFALGTNRSAMVISGNLNLNGTLNFTNAAGFTATNYTLFTYTGSLNSEPGIGTVPDGYYCDLDTGTAGQVKVAAIFTGIFSTNTTNTLQSSPNPSNFGTPVILTATISPAPTNGETVTFMDGTITLGTGAVVGGQATFTTTPNQLATGYYSLTAVYPGDGLYEASTSPVLTQTVNLPVGTYFSDTFAASTVDSFSPAEPTGLATSYQVFSGKSWNPVPSINSGGLNFGIGATSSGVVELQALFTTTPIQLLATGDFVQFQVTFTDSAGILAQNGFWSFGLYNSGGSLPVAGGLNGNLATSSATAATGGAQDWEGYLAQIGYTGSPSSFYDRQPQPTGTANNDQDLVSTGTSSSYTTPAANLIGLSSTTPSTALIVGSQYTEVLNYTLTSSNALQLQSQLYAGIGTTGAVMSTMSAITGTTPLTNSFDGLAIGWRAEGSTASTMAVNSITVTGQSTPPMLQYVFSGNALTLTWPANYLGWLVQSNAAGLASSNWFTVPGSGNATNLTINPISTGTNVFYRLVYP